MKKNIKILLCFLLLLTIYGCQGCSLFNPETISIDIAFEEESPAYVSFHRIKYVENMAYINETLGEYHTVMAFDLDKGELVWRKSPVEDMSSWIYDAMFYTELSIIKNNIWIPCYYNGEKYIVEMDTNTGERLKTVSLEDDYPGLNFQGNTTVSDGEKLYFCITGVGICSFDPEDLTLTDSENRIYDGKIVPLFLWEVLVFTIQIIDGDLVFSYRSPNNYANSGIIRLDMETWDKVWQIKGESVFDDYAYYDGHIFADSVSYPDNTGDSECSRFISYNWESGVFERDYNSISQVTRGEAPPTFYEDYIIQTTSMNMYSTGSPYIYCLDKDTLSLIWKHDYEGSGSGVWSGSNVQVNNGLVYQPTSSGVRVYDLETGDQLGYDDSFAASDIANIMTSYKYNDILVIQTGESLLGIKMNYVKNFWGILEKQ